MSNKAFVQFVMAVRDACDQYIQTQPPPALKKVTRENVAEHPHFAHPSKKAEVEGNPICTCNHNYNVHVPVLGTLMAPPQDANLPRNICRGCEADGRECLGFVAKHASGKKAVEKAQAKAAAAARREERTSNGTSDGMTVCHTAILAALRRHDRATAQQLSIFTIYTQSGTFNAAIADLRDLGLIEGSPHISLTPLASAITLEPGNYRPASLRSAWIAKLKKEPEKRIIDALTHGPLTVSQLAEACRYTQSGTFNAALAKLRRMGLVERGNPVRLCKELL